jgi:hypothetical protein
VRSLCARGPHFNWHGNLKENNIYFSDQVLLNSDPDSGLKLTGEKKTVLSKVVVRLTQDVQEEISSSSFRQSITALLHTKFFLNIRFCASHFGVPKSGSNYRKFIRIQMDPDPKH